MHYYKGGGGVIVVESRSSFALGWTPARRAKWRRRPHTQSGDGQGVGAGLGISAHEYDGGGGRLRPREIVFVARCPLELKVHFVKIQ